ncbi:MAG: sigma-70 family RNA polymerase sigma factor [bacterium]
MELEDFKIQVLPLKNKLFRIAKRLLNDYEEAEDALQEIMLKIWGKRNELDKYHNIESFAVTVTKNYCIDLIRARKAKTLEINEEFLENSSDNPETGFQKSELFALINKAISELQELPKLALQLREIEGYSIEEIAKIMDTSIGNVRVILSRARNQLRNILVKKYKFNYERY